MKRLYFEISNYSVKKCVTIGTQSPDFFRRNNTIKKRKTNLSRTRRLEQI